MVAVTPHIDNATARASSIEASVDDADSMAKEPTAIILSKRRQPKISRRRRPSRRRESFVKEAVRGVGPGASRSLLEDAHVWALGPFERHAGNSETRFS